VRKNAGKGKGERHQNSKGETGSETLALQGREANECFKDGALET